MKRVLVAEIPKSGELVELSDEEHRHLQRVRRIPPGTELEILDGAGGIARGLLISVDRKKAIVRIEEHLDLKRESDLELSLALAMPHQKSTLENLLPALVQLGVKHLHLFYSQFSGREKGSTEKQMGRYEIISRQAIKQCGRLVLPVIHQPSPLVELLPLLVESCDKAIVFHPISETIPHQAEASRAIRQLMLLVGPEGGLTTKEYRTAVEAGWQAASLGPRILRMETAATGACFWAQAVYGDYVGLA